MAETPRDALHALELAALIILENGGETYRVEETVRRMGAGFGHPGVNAVCTVTGLFLSLQVGDEELTVVRRVQQRSNNLARVDAANAVSRQVAEGQLTPCTAVEKLQAIQQSFWVRKPVVLLCSGLTSGFFACMFAGGALEFAIAFACGITVNLMCGFLRKLDMYLVIQSLLGGVLCALFAVVGNLLWGTSVEAVIAGSLMPLLPGLAMTSAVRDTMRGDLLSGVTRAVEALLVAALLATGVAVMLRLGLTWGGIFA